jgi:hypothetical protein
MSAKTIKGGVSAREARRLAAMEKNLRPHLHLKRMHAAAGSIRVLPSGDTLRLFGDLEGLAPPLPPVGRWRSLLARMRALFGGE